ncbi:MAG: CoA-binding protein [Candidatus Bathyarchaeota archaeon]|nr:CoA-binding protein [Candidatus Bathyarchaeota archaeon]MDH5663068.1 CoA-binding protein [Candidatus Bathyarchaeota archaeon]
MERLREFEVIFYPKSVAVIGASTETTKFGTVFLDSLVQFGFKGRIYPINPQAKEIMGLKTYPNVKDIPDPVDLAFITIPASAVPKVLEDCIAKNVGAVVILAAGFGETGKEEGRKLEREIAKISKEGDVRVVGPNCFGIYCPASGLTLLPGANFSKESGNVAFLSQSGGYAERFCQQAKGLGIRFSKVVSYGNACDLNETDFMEYLAEDPDTKIIALYIEGVKDGQRFLQTVQEINKRKPVIVWKGGLCEGGGRAVVSHTGALGGRKDIWDAFFRQTGAVRVNSLEELIDTILIFQHLSSSCGRRVAVMGTGGGTGVAAADACERAGLRVPAFNTKTLEQLRTLVPPIGASIQNPIDLGNPWTSPSTYRRIIKIASSDPQIDALIIVMWHLPLFYARRELLWKSFQQIVEVPITIGKRQRKHVVIVLCATPTEVEMLEVEGEWRRIKDRYIAARIPVYPTVERAAKALNNFIAYHESQKHINDSSTK